MFTLPDPVPINPLAQRGRARGSCASTRRSATIAAARGAIVVDLDAHPVSSDRRLWNEDRLHANPEGHRRIALAAAQALGLPDADASWTDVFTDPLGPPLAASTRGLVRAATSRPG